MLSSPAFNGKRHLGSSHARSRLPIPTSKARYRARHTPLPLSKLLALQRVEEPDVALAFFETTGEDLVTGLHESRYDVGISLQGSGDPSLNTQSLWAENIAVALPPRSSLQDQDELTLVELLDHPVLRWPAEVCPLLEQHLSSPQSTSQWNVHRVPSFESMALWVSAGFGLGLSAQSRIWHARGWQVDMRPLSDGPYQIVTRLQRPPNQINPVAERFEHRALRVARANK